MKRLMLLCAVVLLILAVVLACLMQTPNPTAIIGFSSGHEIAVRLYYDKAPNTVKNFIYLADSGFYNGKPVHRVAKDSLMQMGDPKGDGTGNAGYYITGEFTQNGFEKNDLSHSTGMLSMARQGSPDDPKFFNTASSQFFILTGENSSYDGYYACFGEIIRGYDAFSDLDDIAVDENGRPLEELLIVSVTVDTYGKEYPEPDMIELPS